MTIEAANLRQDSRLIPLGKSEVAPPEQFREAAAAWCSAGRGAGRALIVVLDRYERSTGTQSYRPLAVLRPSTPLQVQQIVKIAAAHRIAIHAISKGKNWGYGDAARQASSRLSWIWAYESRDRA